MKTYQLATLGLGLALLGTAFGTGGEAISRGPAGEEATFVSMAQSLVDDGDLRYEPKDLARAYRLWEQGPRGLALFSPDGGASLRYAEPVAFPLVAAPFYAALGVRGFAVLNAGLLLGLVLGGWWILGGPGGGVVSAAYFLGSAALLHTFSAGATLFQMACAFVPLAIWRFLRERPSWGRREWLLLAAAGAALGAGTAALPALSLLALPLAAGLLATRRAAALPALFAPALVVLVGLSAVQAKGTGRWNPDHPQGRHVFHREVPGEMGFEDPWSAEATPAEKSPSTEGAPLGLEAVYQLIGRHSGALPYFPFALYAVAVFALGAGAARWPRSEGWWILLASAGAFAWMLATSTSSSIWATGGALPGDARLAALYPAFFFLPGALRPRRLLLLPALAAAVWTLPLLPLQAEARRDEVLALETFEGAAHRLLPLEIGRLSPVDTGAFWMRPVGEALWLLPLDDVFAEEEHPEGFWVRGARWSELVVVSPVPLASLRFSVQSIAPGNVLTLDSGARSMTVAFTTAAMRQGTPVKLPLGRPLVRESGRFFPGPEYLYRITLSTTGGVVPMRIDRRSQDPRYLGVFVQL